MQNTIQTGDPFFDDLTPDEMKIIGYLLCGFNEEDILREDPSIDQDTLPHLIASILEKNEVKTQAELQAVYFGPIPEETFLRKAFAFGLKEKRINAARLLLQGESKKKILQRLDLKNYRSFLENCYRKLGIQKAEEIFVLFHDNSGDEGFLQNYAAFCKHNGKEHDIFHQRSCGYFNQLAKGKLTPAELEVIPYVLKGLPNKTIADKIPYIAFSGYQERLKSIFRKCRELGLTNITSKEKLQAHFYSSAYVWDEEMFQRRCAKAKLGEAAKRVIRGLLEGKANKEIANAIGISPLTVNDYLKVIHRKLGIHDRKRIFAVFYGDMTPIKLMGPLKEQSFIMSDCQQDANIPAFSA